MERQLIPTWIQVLVMSPHALEDQKRVWLKNVHQPLVNREAFERG